MSDFSVQFAQGGEEQLKYTFGETITYTPATGDATTPTAIIHRNVYTETIRRDTGDVIKMTGVVEVFESDIASVNIDDKITYDSKAWDILNMPTKNNAKWEIEVVRIEEIESADENYRQDLP